MELLLSLTSDVRLHNGDAFFAAVLIVSIIMLPAKFFFPVIGAGCFFYGLYRSFTGGSLGMLLMAGGAVMVLYGFYLAFKEEKTKAAEAQETLDSITQKMKRARRKDSLDE